MSNPKTKKVPRNLRIKATPEDVLSPYIYGDAARMLLEGGKFNESSRGPRVSHWTLGDLYYSTKADDKNTLATEKDLAVKVKGYEGTEFYYAPDKTKSNITYIGQITRFMLLAGWTPEQVLRALDDPQHVGAHFWQWRKLKGEKSLLKWFHETMMTTRMITTSLLIIPNEKPRQLDPNEINLGWIDGDLRVIDLDTGEEQPLSSTPYYKETVRRYENKQERRTDKYKKRIQAQHDDNLPKYVNSQGGVYSIKYPVAETVYKYVLRNEGATAADIKRRLPAGTYDGTVRGLLEQHGVLRTEPLPRPAGSKGGPTPKGYHVDDQYKTWSAWESFVEAQWGYLPEKPLHLQLVIEEDDDEEVEVESIDLMEEEVAVMEAMEEDDTPLTNMELAEMLEGWNEGNDDDDEVVSLIQTYPAGNVCIRVTPIHSTTPSPSSTNEKDSIDTHTTNPLDQEITMKKFYTLYDALVYELEANGDREPAPVRTRTYPDLPKSYTIEDSDDLESILSKKGHLTPPVMRSRCPRDLIPSPQWKLDLLHELSGDMVGV